MKILLAALLATILSARASATAIITVNLSTSNVSNLTGDVTGTASGNNVATTAVGSSNSTGFSVAGQETVVSTLTVQGPGFSVGGSTFVVAGGSATVAYGLTAQTLTAADFFGSHRLTATGGGQSLVQSGSGSYFTQQTATSNNFIGEGDQLVSGGGTDDLGVRSTAGGILFSIGTSEKMRVANNGNVGIGAPTPGVPLQVNGDGGVGNIAIAGNQHVFWQAYPGSASFNLYYDNLTTGSPTIFRTSNASPADTNAIFILSDGKVGIGAVPLDSLDVNGAIRAESNSAGFSASSATVVDYVPGSLNGRVVATSMSSSYPDLTLANANNGGYGTHIQIHGTSVGVNTDTPTTAFDVNGSAQFGSTAKSTFTAAGELVFPNATAIKMTNTVGTQVNAINVDASNNMNIGGVGVNQIINETNMTQGQGFFQFNSQTIAGLLAITPSGVGQSYYCSNCSPPKIVTSTGTSAGNFADAVGGAFK